MKQSWTINAIKSNYNNTKYNQTSYNNTIGKISTIKEEKILSSKNKGKSKKIFDKNLRAKTAKKRLDPLRLSTTTSKYKNVRKITENEKQQISKEYLNVLSIKKINFQFEEYGDYPDEVFQPSIFFQIFDE